MGQGRTIRQQYLYDYGRLKEVGYGTDIDLIPRGNTGLIYHIKVLVPALGIQGGPITPYTQCLLYYFVHQMFVLLFRTGVCRTQCLLHAFACLSYYFVHQMFVLLFRTGGCRTQCLLHAFTCLSY